MKIFGMELNKLESATTLSVTDGEDDLVGPVYLIFSEVAGSFYHTHCGGLNERVTAPSP